MTEQRYTVRAELGATDDGVVWELTLTVRSDGLEPVPSAASVAHVLDTGLTMDEAQGLLDEALGAVGLRGDWRGVANPEAS